MQQHRLIVGFFYFLTFALGQIVLAQPRPCFEANITRGCAPLTIQIQECTNGGINLLYRFGEGANNPTPNTTYTYTTPGRYSITQLGSFSGQGDSLRKEDYIEVLPTPMPQIQVFRCSNRQVMLEVLDTQYETYIIDWGDGVNITIPRGASAQTHAYNTTDTYTIKVRGNYTPGGCGEENAQLITPLNVAPTPHITQLISQNIDTQAGSLQVNFEAQKGFSYQVQYRKLNESTFQDFVTLPATAEGTQNVLIPNLNTAQETYCLRLRLIDKCQNILESTTFCHLALQVEGRDSENLLTWRAYPLADNFQHYTIVRNGQVREILNDRLANQWLDREVLCKQQYCYGLVAHLQNIGQNTQVQSNNACVQVFSSLQAPAVRKLNATIQSTKSVAISWEIENVPRIISYTLLRNETDTLRSVGDSPLALDNDIDTQTKGSFCYEVSYLNECGNASAVALRTCTVFLRLALQTTTQALLQWSDYANSDNQWEGYYVQKLDEQGNIIAEIWNGKSNSWADATLSESPQKLQYRIKTLVNSTFVSYSNTISIEQKPKLFAPNAFSPNGDGQNDTFEVQGLHIKSFQMVIYNRLGEKMFQTFAIQEGWNGQIQGKPAPQDTYIYVIDAEDFTGQKHQQRGTFVLLR